MQRGTSSLLAARDTTTRYEIPSAAVSRSSLRIRFDNLTSIPSGRPPLYHRPEFRTIPGRVKVFPHLFAVLPRNRARHSFIESIDEAHGMRLPSGFSSHVFSLGFEPLKTAGYADQLLTSVAWCRATALVIGAALMGKLATNFSISSSLR